MFHAKGPGVKAEEEERWFDRTVGRADLQSPGRDGLSFIERTPSGMIVWYPRFGEGQDGVAHFVSNKARNA